MEKYISKVLKDHGYEEADLEATSSRTILNEMLEEEGIIGYTEWIIKLIQDIWEIDL